MDGQRLVGHGGRDRDRVRRRQERHRHPGMDGAAGRLEDGPRLSGRLRRREDQQLSGLARLLRGLPARARRLAASALASQRRPARAAVVLGIALVLQPRQRLHGDAARLPAALLAPAALRLGRAARRAEPGRGRVAGLAARRRDGVSRRLPRRPERARVERDRRRLLGRDRGRPDRPRPEPLRALPRRGHAPRRAARPTSTARSATGSRRTAGARPRTRSATPTARSPISPTSPAT